MPCAGLFGEEHLMLLRKAIYSRSSFPTQNDRMLVSRCASNLTVNFSTILVGRAGEPVSVFNLDAPQLKGVTQVREKWPQDSACCWQVFGFVRRKFSVDGV